MSGPVLHHRALGVHPAAFVGPTAPDTTDVQDHVLWVDTATLPPYRLKMWEVAATAWRDVGSVMPQGTEGSILFQDQGTWLSLPIGLVKEELTVTPVGTTLQPRWQPCCGADALGDTPTTITDTGGSDPGITGTTPATACGAALAMSTGLEEVYKRMVTQLDMFLTQLTQWTLALVVDVVTVALTDGLGIPVLAGQQAVIVAAARFVLRGLHTTVWSPLTPTQKHTILGALYCALPRGTNTFTIDQAILQAWIGNLDSAGGSLFSVGQLGTLERLITAPTLAAWNYIANTGAQTKSNVCDVFVCGGGKSMSGGALIGGQGSSMSGGALYGSINGLCLSGGAQFGAPTLAALSGGAYR